MSENNIAKEYSMSFTKPSMRIGAICVALAMVGSFLPNIYLFIAYGVWPDLSHMLSAWGSIAIAFGAFYLVEPVSYFPIFGVTGTYIGILSGNISQIRLPAASTAQDVLGVTPTSEKGEVVGILAICGSIITNIVFLTVAVVAGSALMSMLPESITSAMSSFILPSLFGACFTSMAVKNYKIALYALPIVIILRLVKAPGYLCIIGAVFGTILITYALYKKKIIK